MYMGLIDLLLLAIVIVLVLAFVIEILRRILNWDMNNIFLHPYIIGLVIIFWFALISYKYTTCEDRIVLPFQEPTLINRLCDFITR